MCIRDSHHAIPDWLLIQTFYNGLEQSVKISVDAVAGGAFMGKFIEAAKALLEEMTSNNYHWGSDKATPQRGGGKYAVDAVALLASRVDALAQRLEKVSSSPSPGGSSGSNIEILPYVRPVVCRGTRLLSVTMAHLP